MKQHLHSPRGTWRLSSSCALVAAILAVTVGAFSFMGVETVSARSPGGASSTDWAYRPQNSFISLGKIYPNIFQPDGLPLCAWGSDTLVCYPPSFLRTAYDYPTTLDGSGQTIIVVDAYGSRTAAIDLAIFDRIFGLPDAPSFVVFC